MTNSDSGQVPEQPPTPGPEIRPLEPNERIIRANGVDLGVQTFGDRVDPPMLLIMGGASSMDWWEDGFCERLAAGSRFVIRYDHRDTGRSVSYEPGAAPYSLRDLAEDAVGLLDAWPWRAPIWWVCRWGGGSASSWRSTIPIGSHR